MLAYQKVATTDENVGCAQADENVAKNSQSTPTITDSLKEIKPLTQLWKFHADEKIICLRCMI